MALSRTYILSGIVAFFAAAILGITAISAACGGDDDDQPTTGDNFPESERPDEQVAPGDRKPINIVMAGSDWAVGENNFVFGITNEKDEPVGGAQATVTFYDVSDSSNPKAVATLQAVQSAPGVGPEVTHVHQSSGETHVHGGEDENRVGYYVTFNFTHAGFWGIVVDATLPDGTKGQDNVGFTVAEAYRYPSPGEPAIKSDNLTRRDVADIKEIDSGDPPNDMHEVKIKDAIASGRPLVIVFSTPAYCTSRFCGPVNEEVEALQEVYKDRVDFVHIEIWSDFAKQQPNPTVKEWLVQPNGGFTEPFVYVVDKSGMIFDRWEGPVARNIMESSVKAVAEGQVYSAQ